LFAVTVELANQVIAAVIVYQLCLHSVNWTMNSYFVHWNVTLRYDTIEEINVDSKAEYTA